MTAELRRPWPNPRERAWVYREQLAEITTKRLRAQFLEMITSADPEAAELMK